ncbi:MAG: recombinase family protein [Planctomycetes bacterium]|nr:recombinase family protein [Planctomycetota bacterium]
MTEVNKKKRRPLTRFAALIRVSTEKQQAQGESLRTQTQQIEQAVATYGGQIVDWYGGQEHATAGWEHGEVDRLLDYCERQPRRVDAVMVAHQDRWSRDNISSEQGLNRLQQAGIRFFVLSTEHNLNEPTARLYLGMSSAIGAYQAATQKKKSIENRIARARRGVPTAGKLPFGRTFDRATETWTVDPVKQASIEEVASRYLAGESLEKISMEHGVNHASLHKTLMKRTGPDWSVTFKVDGVVIRDKPLIVPITIPPLLPPETIHALNKRAKANKTYAHGTIKNDYLLRRVVFCARCGYAMFGQTNHNGKRYYRHCHTQRAHRCDGPLHSVPADVLEETVLLHLWAAFGNVGSLTHAMKEAIPNKDRVEKYRKRRDRVIEELQKVMSGRDRVLAQLEKETISEDEATQRLDKSKPKMDDLSKEKDRLDSVLRNLPDEKTIRDRAENIASIMSSHKNWETMTYDEKRTMIKIVFSGTEPMNTELEWEEAKARGEEPTPVERRMGVYVDWVPGEEKKRQKVFEYSIRGNLISEEHLMPLGKDEKEFLANHYDMGVPTLQEKLTKSASYSPARGPPERRWCPGLSRPRW